MSTQQIGLPAPGVLQALWVFTSPSALFRRVEDTGAYGWTLITLLALVTLIGYAEVQTGLIDLVEDRKTEQRLAELEESQGHLVDRVEFREQVEDIRKQGEFTKLIARLWAIVFSPGYMLVSALLVSSCLYAAVALTGRKPEYHTLLAICVYAAYLELAALVLRLGMMLYYRTNDVGTSLGVLATSKGTLWLAAIDPFRIWFWVVVAIGVAVTQQLSRRMAIVSCTGMCLLAMGVRAAKEYLPV